MIFLSDTNASNRGNDTKRKNGQLQKSQTTNCQVAKKSTRGHIFSRVRPFYEQAVSDLDRSMHRSLWVQVAHSSFMEGLLMTKNTALVHFWCFMLLMTSGYVTALIDFLEIGVWRAEFLSVHHFSQYQRISKYVFIYAYCMHLPQTSHQIDGFNDAHCLSCCGCSFSEDISPNKQLGCQQKSVDNFIK